MLVSISWLKVNVYVTVVRNTEGLWTTAFDGFVSQTNATVDQIFVASQSNTKENWSWRTETSIETNG